MAFAVADTSWWKLLHTCNPNCFTLLTAEENCTRRVLVGTNLMSSVVVNSHAGYVDFFMSLCHFGVNAVTMSCVIVELQQMKCFSRKASSSLTLRIMVVSKAVKKQPSSVTIQLHT